MDHLLGRVADAVLGQVHLVPGELGEASADRLEAELVVALTLGPAEVRGEDDLRPGLDGVLDGGEGGLDPRVVRDLAALLVERRVEVDPDEDPLVGQPVALLEGAELQVLDRRDVVEDAHVSAPFSFAALFEMKTGRDGQPAATSFARSIMRLEKPHSLSYQAKTFTMLPPMTVVRVPSTVELAGLPM